MAVPTLERLPGDGAQQPLDAGNRGGCVLRSQSATWGRQPRLHAGMRPRDPSCHTAFRDREKGLNKQAKEHGPYVFTPALGLRMDQVPVVSSSPGRGRAGLPPPPLNNCLWVSAGCYCWPFWFHSQFPDNCPHCCQLCPGHFCHDPKGTTSGPRLPTSL